MLASKHVNKVMIQSKHTKERNYHNTDQAREDWETLKKEEENNKQTNKQSNRNIVIYVDSWTQGAKATGN